MKRIGALHRAGAAFGDHLGDPVGLIGRDMRDLRAALGAELVKKQPQGRPIAPGRGPQQPARVMIDDHGQGAKTALVSDLIDADPTYAIEPITAHALDVGPDARNDRPDGAPRDPHQLRDRRL